MSGRFRWLFLLAVGLILITGCAPPARETATTTKAPQPVAAPALFSSPGGQSVEVTNPSRDALALVEWAFGRFKAAGIAEPTVRRIDFAANSPKCEDATGWAATGGDAADVVVCLEVHRMCREINGLVFTVAGRICILHELAHLWLSDHVTEPERHEFMELTGAASWRDPDVPWAERGVEEAADTIAWGLLGGTIEILGRPLPPCELLQDGFIILTGVAPTSDCDHFRP